MNKHPYLRAYLAGIAVPTVFLLLVMTGYTVIRYVYAVPLPIERVIVFPMAAVPNAWGLWNVLYRAFFAGRRVSLGVFGGALLLPLAPGGYVVTRLLDITVPWRGGRPPALLGSVRPAASGDLPGRQARSGGRGGRLSPPGAGSAHLRPSSGVGSPNGRGHRAKALVFS